MTAHYIYRMSGFNGTYTYRMSGFNGTMPVHLNPEKAFSIVTAFRYAVLNSSPSCSTVILQPGYSRNQVEQAALKAVFNDLKKLRSRACNLCDVWGCSETRITPLSRAYSMVARLLVWVL